MQLYSAAEAVDPELEDAAALVAQEHAETTPSVPSPPQQVT